MGENLLHDRKPLPGEIGIRHCYSAAHRVAALASCYAAAAAIFAGNRSWLRRRYRSARLHRGFLVLLYDFVQLLIFLFVWEFRAFLGTHQFLETLDHARVRQAKVGGATEALHCRRP